MNRMPIKLKRELLQCEVCSTAISGQPTGAQLLIFIRCEKQQQHNSRADYANNEIGSVYVARALIDEF